MFSGKSEEMIRRLRRAEIAGQRVVVAQAAATAVGEQVATVVAGAFLRDGIGPGQRQQLTQRQ